MSKDAATFEAQNRRKLPRSKEPDGFAPRDPPTADDPSAPSTPTTTVGRPSLRPDPAPPDGRPVPLLDLRPGDRVHLPLATDGADPLRWSEPVTVTGVLLVDSGLVEVRWEPEADGDRWAAHLLLMGQAYAAGALRAR
jgi:hypothetical protein